MYYDDWGTLTPPEPEGNRKAEELGATIIIVLVVLLVAWLCSGCASTAELRAKTATEESPFDLKTLPAIAFVGGDVRITCHVPESLGRGVIRLALEGVTASGPKQLEHVQNILLVQHVDCGNWKATCRVVAEGGTRYAERDVEVKGGMCEGDGHPR